jgi:hypothetical protein
MDNVPFTWNRKSGVELVRKFLIRKVKGTGAKVDQGVSGAGGKYGLQSE